MDAVTTIAKLINSPPGQLAAGGVLAGIVWKFFERVEAVLTEQTKLEIAVWLLGLSAAQSWREITAIWIRVVCGSPVRPMQVSFRQLVVMLITSAAGFTAAWTPIVHAGRTAMAGKFICHSFTATKQ
jgi:hypothetical protein